MEFHYEIQLTSQGLPRVDKNPDADLHIRHSDGQIYIVGNQAGLLLLAKSLISLALVPDQPKGYHLHLDPRNVLDQESTPVTIYNDMVFHNG